MRIIYLHQYFKFPDENGGTRSYDLATTFVSRGMKVIIITSTSNEKWAAKKRWTVCQKDGLEIHYIYVQYDNRMSYVRRLRAFMRFLWAASSRLLKIKADLVLATSTPLTIGIPALIKKWFTRTPYVFEVRDVWPEAVIAIGAVRNRLVQQLLYALEYVIYRNASTIVPLSSDMQRSIVTRYPKFTAKTNVVIENIAELNRFQVRTDCIDLHKVIGFIPRFSVLYAGTFGKVNGVHKFVELAEKTLSLDKKLVYILIGDGAEKEHVSDLAEEKGVLGRNLFIMDPVAKKDLPAWYYSVSMGSTFVINIEELWANSANKFFDTLAAGRPVLINHEGWQADTIRECNVGYVLPQAITTQAAKDFVRYTLDEHLIARQMNDAPNLARNNYSLQVASEKYNAIFHRIHANSN